MCWVAQLGGESLQLVENINDLYHAFVGRYLNRIPKLSRKRRYDLLIAMTRLGLVLLAQDGRTRLSLDEAEQALQDPESGKNWWWPWADDPDMGSATDSQGDPDKSNSISRSTALLCRSDYCVKGSNDDTVRVWDPNVGEVVTMNEHLGAVNCVAALPDGRIVSGSDDQTVKVWDPQTGAVVTMSDMRSSITHVAVTSDGCIVSLGSDGSLRHWNPDSGEVTSL